MLPNSGSGGAYGASEVVWSVAVRELRPCHAALWQGATDLEFGSK